ncbi:MAG: type II toxin-antitoxin system HipA family toxin [Gammaproteobacteria bacterium]|nr:type II toxin-antitoxin system HipA family toxin [Gammaproteobacteria bacterium]
MVAAAVDTCEVLLWGRVIGAAYWDDAEQLAAFEYHPEFQASRIELAPITMPLSGRIYRFPALRRSSFRGLPGLLADSLPDDFGNAIIDQWLIREGRTSSDFSPIERLCYIGQRGMGALEFRPAIRETTRGSVAVDIAALTELAQHVLDLREGIKVHVRAGESDYSRSLDDILRVGTSAGGARAKAVIAWNPQTGEMRSGQVQGPDGFEYWLLKFDGVSNREHGLSDPDGYGRIEYAYSLMARAAGISMMPCRLLEEGGRAHFMTQRFDRLDQGEKVHMQSLYAMAHLDNQLAGAHSYEQAFDVLEKIHAPREDLAELFRRMVLNVVARNQDDHTKNIAFLMDKSGRWSLAPAFDVIYSYNPAGEWTRRHQMSINGRTEDFGRQDFLTIARRMRIKDADDLIDAVSDAVADWHAFATAAKVPTATAERIADTHRSVQH